MLCCYLEIQFEIKHL